MRDRIGRQAHCRVVPVRGLEGRAQPALVLAVWCALVVGALGHPLAATAGWPLVQAAPVTLGFGALYSAGGSDSSRHCGVDIAAAVGDRVVTPLAGKVAFAGSVPGVGGGRVIAVTIETADAKITLMPLDSAAVSSGDELREGDSVGTLAATGDASSAGAHLHVGARRGDLYVDPLTIIAPPAPPASEGQGQEHGAGQTAGAGAVAEVGTAAGTRVVGTGGAGSGVGASAKAGAVVPGGMPVGVSLAPGPSTAKAGRSPALSAAGLGAGVSLAVRCSAAAGSAGAVAGAQAYTTAVLPDAATPAQAGVADPAAAAQVRAGSAGGEAGAADSAPRWLAALVTGTRSLLVRSVHFAGLVLLGVFAALGALWPLWRRRPRKGIRKVRVSSVGEDVAAAPGR